MYTNRLVVLIRILEERIGSLIEEVEIATNVKLNPLYINDRNDEIESLRWVMRVIQWILDQTNGTRQQLGVTNLRLDLDDTKKLANILDEKIQELEIELEDSVTVREKEVLTNRIETLKCVLGHLFNLKSNGDNIEIKQVADANNNFQITDREGEQLIKTPDLVETEMSTQLQK
jgi:hypothetical protein